MRIACIHLPSLPLQAFVRRAPRWIGAPVAVLRAGARGTSPVVAACSRAAWAAGVRPGMSGLAAHELVAGLVTHSPDSADRDVLRALGDALLGIAGRVDLGGDPSGTHHAIYAEVPARTRGATFGARILEVVEAQGLRARVGIADDRFTAWVAASRHDDGDDVVTVPRGGSAAFLAPLPLSLLAISPEVQHVLNALGVRTLGEFAALPPPSPLVTATWDLDYQTLARGDGGSRLVPHAPAGRIVERVEIGGDIGVGAALERAARRVAGRLTGRGQAAAQVLVRTSSDGNGELDIALAAPVADARDLADAIGRALHDATSSASAFVEIDIPVTVAADPAASAIPRPVAAEASAPMAVASEPPVFQLVPPAAILSISARDPHRRTHRGKHRTRAAVAAQSRLFKA